jgi:hypothetical protein
MQYISFRQTVIEEHGSELVSFDSDTLPSFHQYRGFFSEIQRIGSQDPYLRMQGVLNAHR